MVLVVLCVVPGDGGKAVYQVSRVHVHLHPMVPTDHLRLAHSCCPVDYGIPVPPHDHPGADPQITFGTSTYPQRFYDFSTQFVEYDLGSPSCDRLRYVVQVTLHFS